MLAPLQTDVSFYFELVLDGSLISSVSHGLKPKGGLGLSIPRCHQHRGKASGLCLRLHADVQKEVCAPGLACGTPKDFPVPPVSDFQPLCFIIGCLQAGDDGLPVCAA